MSQATPSGAPNAKCRAIAGTARDALDKWRELVAVNDKLSADEASARTVDEKLAARIVSELWKKTRA